MNLQDLTIKNFLTIGEASINLDNRGLLLVQGVNEDDSSAISNGAGKSSIVDAICWCLYGTTARGVSGDAVVHRIAKKDCSVTLELMDGADLYRVTRHRKHKVNANQLFVHRVDGAATIDMSKGTDKETQGVLEKLIGCSLEVFTSSVYAGQEQMPDLPGMTDKMLKTLIEEAAGVEVLTEAYNIARAQYNAATAATAVKEAQFSQALEKQMQLEKQLLETELKVSEFDAGRKTRAYAKLAEVLPIQQAVKGLQATLMTHDEAKAISDLEIANKALESAASEQKERDRMQAEVVPLERAVAASAASARMLKEALDREVAALKDIDSLVGKPCGECGKTYCEHDLEAARTARLKSIEESKAAVLKEASKVLKLKTELNAAKEVLDKFVSGMTVVTDVLSKRSNALFVTNEVVRLKRDIDSSNAKIVSIKEEAARIMKEPNAWAVVLDSVKEQIAKHEEAIEELRKNVDKARAESELYADAVSVFGPAGMRAHILDTVTPFLNERTHEYIGALSDGNISAIWSTLTKSAKGDLKEKFSIDVSNKTGADSFKGLSGGEKRKVRLACALALQDLVASRATKPIDLFVGDEIDDAVDPAGLERLMGILERKAKDRGTVLIISHNSLADWCDQVVTVKKNGGYSTIEEVF